MLENKSAVIYGAGGAIGGAVGAAGGALLKRLPTLAEVANTAAFMASDQAGAMTGTVANLTCGFLVD